MKIKTIEQTCFACPSQWEGTLEDGRAFYGRYRHGWLRFTVAADLDKAITGADYDSDDIIFEQQGDPFDGFMTIEDLLARLAREGVTA